MGRTVNLLMATRRKVPGALRQRSMRMTQGRWSFAAAICCGRSHVATGKPCQDAVFTRTYKNGVYVTVLCDGAGSASHSREGARFAAARAGEFAARSFAKASRSIDGARHAGRELLESLQHDIARYARDRGCGVADLSSTLLLVAVRGNKYVMWHVGDGVIGAEQRRSDGACRLAVMSAPDNGEFANQTRFVTASDACDHLDVRLGRLVCGGTEVSGFILMSDGPEAALYHKATGALAPACSKLLQGCRDFDRRTMEARLHDALETVIAAKTSDDCSLVLLAR